MTIIDALRQLRDDFKTWATNNFKNVLTKQKATNDKVTNLETKTAQIVEDESATLQFADPEGNIVAQIDESGLNTTGIKVNGKEVALREDLTIVRNDDLAPALLQAYMMGFRTFRDLTAAEVTFFNQFIENDQLNTIYCRHEWRGSRLEYFMYRNANIKSIKEGGEFYNTKRLLFSTLSEDNNLIMRVDINPDGAETLGTIEVTKRRLSYTNDLNDIPKISGTVTKAIGGIAKDKTYTNAPLETVLSELLFPYVELSFSSISLKDSNKSTISSTLEYGEKVTVEYVMPSFTKGSKDITSIKIGTTSDGDDLYSGTTATSGTNIDLTTSKTFDGETGGTIYCTIGDGEKTWTKSSSINYKYYNYYTVTNSTTKPTTGTNNGEFVQADITTTDNSYIWFLMPDTSKTQIQQFAMNQWNNVNTTYEGTVATFKTSTDQTVTYHAYRTDKMMSATGTYRIN